MGLITHIKLPKRKSVEAAMCGAKYVPQAGATEADCWASLLLERWVRWSSGRAAATGARAISVRQMKDGLSGRPLRNWAAGVFSGKVQGTGRGKNQKAALHLGNSSGGRGRERLIREKIIGHRMRAGLVAGRGRIVGTTKGRSLALLHQPAREHREGVFIEPLVEKDPDFLSKVGGVRKPREFVGLERGS